MRGRSDERRIGQTCENGKQVAYHCVCSVNGLVGSALQGEPRERKVTVSLEQESMHAPLPGNQIMLLEIPLVKAANAEM